MDRDDCLRRAHAERAARLATTRPDGRVDLVPIVFAFVDGDVVFAIDDKPKRTQHVQRLRNIASNHDVTVLFDRYDDDWTQLWWVRMRGLADEVLSATDRALAVDALAAKYPQHAQQRPDGAVVRIRPTEWSGWSFAR